MPRFVPRQRKHKVKAREQNTRKDNASTSNTNVEQIIPVSKSEREARKEALREELRAQKNTTSSKKRKRLDKYIENKLKKDENLELVKKLEDEKARTDTKIIGLQSSKTLGKRDFNEFASDSTRRIERGNLKGFEDDSSAESEDSFEAGREDAFGRSDRDVMSEEISTIHNTVPQGSGLAQPLQIGEDGLPVISTRSRKRRRKKAEVLEQVEELPWEGFGSEDDEYTDKSEEESEEDDPEQSYLRKEMLPESEASEESSADDESESSTTNTSQDDVGETRHSAFKSWATQQLNKSLGHVPSYERPTQAVSLPVPQKSSQEYVNPVLDLKLPVETTNVPKKLSGVLVERSEDIQQARLELPVVQQEQEIMEAINNNPVIIIKGDTGSGKTTQIPQFLYEAGFGLPGSQNSGLIGITQPRRVAAVSMSRRVAEELGSDGEKVAYQIRFDSTFSPKTAIKFMTDGILLRELSQDLLLRKYSAIVIDEAHERSVNTDILIGMLSKIVPARMRKTQFNPEPTPLKLIIMSATLNIDDFLSDRLFAMNEKPPVVEVGGRQHRVTTHFALRSRSDYVEEVVEKVQRAHRKLPKGGILVFLTGQNEIRLVGDQLKRLLSRNPTINAQDTTSVKFAASEAPLEADDIEFGESSFAKDSDEHEIDILTHSDEEDSDQFDISDEEDTKVSEDTIPAPHSSKEPYDSVHVLPLYSQLPTKDQLRVFEPPPPRCRLIVLATNVAETSLTIPGIRFVFDTGRSKERRYNTDTGVQSFEVDYISKASAQQRAGRAGRTGPGHCWRLYSSAVYEGYFPNHSNPEILRVPAESIILQLKAFAYPKPIVQFPFPTPPAAQTLAKAEKLLKNLGALNSDGAITDLGKEISKYPLSPRLGKLLSKGVKDETLLWQVVAIVAGLTVSEMFINESQIDMTPRGKIDDEIYDQEQQQKDDEREKRRQAYGRARATLSAQDKTSDILKLLKAISMYESSVDQEQFCQDYYLHSKAVSEVTQLQRQVMELVKMNNRSLYESKDAREAKLSSKQAQKLNLIVASGYIDQIAIRADLAPNPPDLVRKPKRAIDMPYLPLVPLTENPSASLVEKAIFIHPSSVLSKVPAKELPQYLIYSHLQQSQSHTISSEHATKTRMFPLTPIDASSLANLAHDTVLIEYGKPLPKTKVESLPGLPKRRQCWVSTEIRGGSGFGWHLPPSKVRQIVDIKSSSGWRVEEVIS